MAKRQGQPVHLITVSTATGIHPAAEGFVSFGSPYRFLGYANGGSTKAIAGTIQGSIGGSNKWTTLITFTTANSTGMITSSSGVTVFDKARLNLSGNASTAGFAVWLAASD